MGGILQEKPDGKQDTITSEKTTNNKPGAGNRPIKTKEIMKTLEKMVNSTVDFFILAAKECGFETPQQIEANFEIVAFVAAAMVEESKERIRTKLASNPIWIEYLAARYQSKVLTN